MTTERWLPITGYEGLYEVSDQGRIRSTRRPGARGGLLKLRMGSHGYVTALLSRNGDQKTRRVHRLVGDAFLGPLLPGQESRHGPGGKLDNRVANLSYGTSAENEADKIRDGTSNRGERSGHAKLTRTIVDQCRLRHAAGETQAALAAEFGVTRTTMLRALHGQTWR